MSVKPWLAVLHAFAAIAGLADYSLTRWAIDENPAGNAGRVYHLLREAGDEIPIFGSSRVYHDYVPAQMGVNAYNYGLDGASYEVTDALLQIELAKPKTTPIVIDLKPEADHDIGDPATYIPFVFDSRIRGMLVRNDAIVWRFFVPGLRYFGYYDYYLKELVNDRAQVMRRVERGFTYERYWTFDRARLDDAVTKRLRSTNGFFPDEGQDQRLIAQIRAHTERLFFLVYSPVHASCFTSFQNAAEFAAFKQSLAALPNVVVLDFSRTDYPDQWFMDTNHLLYDGAVDFSRRLGERIKAVLLARASSVWTSR